MFEVTMLAASEGDCLVIRYGDPDAPHRVLIDAGRKATFKKLLAFLPENERHLELFVISHVDRDHIEGALQVLGQTQSAFTFDDIWFNAYRHLDWQPDSEDFGAVQGEALTKLIVDRDLPWNVAFGGGPVRLDGEEPAVRTLAGGLKLTLLSPDAAKLLALIPKWEEECRRVGIEPTTAALKEDVPSFDPTWEQGVESFGGTLEELAAINTSEDGAAPNGTSIAFLAEYDGKCVFFGADAHPRLIVRSLDRLGRTLPLECALVKVAHHGSQANTTRELLNRLRSDHFFISTSGSYFNHPDEVAIARILTSPSDGTKILYFNYSQEHTTPWGESTTQSAKYDYRCEYPKIENAPTTLRL